MTQQQPVRAIVRNASKGAEWETKGAEVTVADLFDKASLFNDFKQAEGIFIMTPLTWMMSLKSTGKCFATSLKQLKRQNLKGWFDLRVSMVAVNDIGKLAAELLNQHWAGHRIIELEGPCQYSADDVASSLSYYTTRPITAVPIPRSEYDQTYTSFGFTADASRFWRK